MQLRGRATAGYPSHGAHFPAHSRRIHPTPPRTRPSASSCCRRSMSLSPRLLYSLAICCAKAAYTGTTGAQGATWAGGRGDARASSVEHRQARPRRLRLRQGAAAQPRIALRRPPRPHPWGLPHQVRCPAAPPAGPPAPPRRRRSAQMRLRVEAGRWGAGRCKAAVRVCLASSPPNARSAPYQARRPRRPATPPGLDPCSASPSNASRARDSSEMSSGKSLSSLMASAGAGKRPRPGRVSAGGPGRGHSSGGAERRGKAGIQAAARPRLRRTRNDRDAVVVALGVFSQVHHCSQRISDLWLATCGPRRRPTTAAALGRAVRGDTLLRRRSSSLLLGGRQLQGARWLARPVAQLARQVGRGLATARLGCRFGRVKLQVSSYKLVVHKAARLAVQRLRCCCVGRRAGRPAAALCCRCRRK